MPSSLTPGHRAMHHVMQMAGVRRSRPSGKPRMPSCGLRFRWVYFRMSEWAARRLSSVQCSVRGGLGIARGHRGCLVGGGLWNTALSPYTMHLIRSVPNRVGAGRSGAPRHAGARHRRRPGRQELRSGEALRSRSEAGALRPRGGLGALHPGEVRRHQSYLDW